MAHPLTREFDPDNSIPCITGFSLNLGDRSRLGTLRRRLALLAKDLHAPTQSESDQEAILLEKLRTLSPPTET